MLESSLLWKIIEPDNKTSYLFGTMHVKDDVAFQHLGFIKKRLHQCDYFKTEIDLELAKELLNPEIYLLPDEARVSELIGAKKFNKLQKIFYKSFAFNIEKWDRFLPLIIINKISESIMKEHHALSLDAHLWNEAKRLKIQCSGLETIDEQLSILSSLSIESQCKSFIEAGRNISNFRNQVLALAKHYSQQNISLLYKLTYKHLGEMRKVLLFKRNKIMADRIISSTEKSCFYAVGAAHLAGEKGIIAYLKKNNIKITPIRINE